MGYIDISDYLWFAWLTSLDSATSTRVSLLIDTTQDMLEDLVWDLTYWQKSEDIRVCDISKMWWVQFSNIEIASIDEINGTSFTGVANVEFQIQPPHNSYVEFRYISTYLSWLLFPYFNVKYTSWFVTIPEEIKYLQYLMVVWELNKEWWKEVKSYSLWPRSVTFSDTTSWDTALQIINKYYIPYI